jgi:hypothetical protein
MDMFLYPIFAWRLVEVGVKMFTKKKVKVCLQPTIFKGGDNAGDILPYGHRSNYRKLMLGLTDKPKSLEVFQPLHVLILILKQGPWVCEANLEGLRGREGLSQEQLQPANIECIHVNACQHHNSAHCIGPFCVQYASIKKNAVMARQHKRTMGSRRALPSQPKLTPAPFVAVAHSLANKPSMDGFAERQKWLADQHLFQADRYVLLQRLESAAHSNQATHLMVLGASLMQQAAGHSVAAAAAAARAQAAAAAAAARGRASRRGDGASTSAAAENRRVTRSKSQPQ